METPRRSTRIAVKKTGSSVETVESRPGTTTSTRSCDSGNATLGLDGGGDGPDGNLGWSQTPRQYRRKAKATPSTVTSVSKSRASTPNGNGSRPLTAFSDLNYMDVDFNSPFSDIPTVSPKTPATSQKRKGAASRRNINFIETPATQILQQPAIQPLPATETSQTEISFGNDSLFLCAVDQLEQDKLHQPTPQQNKNKNTSNISSSATSFVNVNNQILTVSRSNNILKSPDIFDDSFPDEDFLEFMPATQQQLDPKKELPHHKIPLNSSRSWNKRKSGEPAMKRRQSTSFRQPPIVDAIDDEVFVAADEPKSKRSAPSKKNKKAQAESKAAAADEKKQKKKKAKFKMAYTNRKAAKKLSSSGNNELRKEELSCLTEEEKLKLSSWGLPQSVLRKYEGKGITSLFPWQLECLANERVLEGKNLLYSAPTSAGKTLVAEILMLKRVLELGKKAIMILPFVSVCREKMYSLQDIFNDAGVRVEGFMGSYCPPGGFKAVDIAICTIEKANSLINRLLEENSLSQLGTIVVDELHLIGDPHRGYLLELLLTKIKYMTGNQRLDETMEGEKPNLQIIGMSATLPNLDLLSTWLDAELVITDYRPVPLVERISHSGKIFDQNLKFIRNVHNETTLPVVIHDDTDNIVYLSLETVLAGHSVLIFCPTKAKCEALAVKIASTFFRIGSPKGDLSSKYPNVALKLREQLNTEKIKEVLTQLEQCPGGLEEVLKDTVSYGVAYHHAGITYDERDIIESSFKRCVLRVIVATSTLSAGVNLPARRVIVSSPNAPMGGTLDVMTYRQMCGRAGRKGVDSEGESILICSLKDIQQGIKLVQSSLPMVKSALLGDEGSLTSSMKRALLEVIASGIATVPDDVHTYAKCSLLSKSIDAGLYDNDEELPTSQRNKEDTIKNCLKFLEEKDFIRLQRYENEEKTEEYMTTQLGSACLASSLAPDDGITVYRELQTARKQFVLDSDLHIIYQVTPIYVSEQLNQVDYSVYLDLWEDLSAEDQNVGKLVGVEHSFIVGLMMSRGVTPKNKQKFMIHHRFYAAMALNDLVNEMPIGEVCKKYSLNKGVVQNLQQSASTFAGMVTAFAGRLGWSNLELLLSQFQERLQFGVQRELCDLVRLSTMNGQRARVLYDNGIKSVLDLAASDPAHVENILHRAAPFQSTVHGSTSNRHIWVLGNDDGLTESEAAQTIVKEARDFIQAEHEHMNIQFNPMMRSEHSGSKFDILGDDGSLPSSSEDDDEDEADDQETDKPHSETKENSQNGRENVSKITDVQLLQGNSQHIQKQEKVEELLENIPSFGAWSEDMFGEDDPCPPEADIHKSNLIEKMEISFDMKNILEEVLESSMDISESHPVQQENKNITPKLNKSHIQQDISDVDDSPSNKSLKHSTPVAEKEKSKDSSKGNKKGLVKSRISAIAPPRHDQESPDVNLRKQVLKTTTNSTPTTSKNTNNPSSNVLCLSTSPVVNVVLDNHEMNSDLLAEFDKDFDSVASLMETSLNISSDNHDIKKNMEKQNEPKLSDSVAAALLAFANDSSKFESEDMFADCDDNEQDILPGEIKEIIPAYPVVEQPKENDSSDTEFSEEGQENEPGPSNYNGNAESSSLFEDSSSFPDSSYCSMSLLSSCKPQPQSARINRSDEEPILSATFGPNNKTIKVKALALASEFIPQEAFKGRVAVGLRIAEEKRSASTGIGNRIIKRKNGTERRHILSLYNGENETIWAFEWEHGDPHSLKGLLRIFRKIKKHSSSVVFFDIKKKIKALLDICGKDQMCDLPTKNILDPKMAQWMLKFFEHNNWNCSIKQIVNDHLELEDKEILNLKWDAGITESFVTFSIMENLEKKLKKAKLWKPFVEIEMPSVIPIMLMELNGFGMSAPELSKMEKLLKFKASLLELKAYDIANRQFNLSSPNEIKKILYTGLLLKQPKLFGKKIGCTDKDTLSKIDHEFARIILEWRKIGSVLSKVVVPYQNIQNDRSFETGRIHGQYSHFTVTGRVVMSEPSLQCVPRDFDLQMEFNSEEIEDIINKAKIKNFSTKVTSLERYIDKDISLSQGTLQENCISMRNVFIPCSDEFVLVSGDYSQLELRILAHLSGDEGLIKALNKEGGDVFVEIASKWKKLPAHKITSSMRQEAKRIVYGVIYGMGAQTLGEQMEVDEHEASEFKKEFLETYPKIQTFLNEAVKNCEDNGYIETISGRRRHLPNIYSGEPKERAQARRQAVNSQIQGSAADLVKRAMCNIYRTLAEVYPESAFPVNFSKYLQNKPKSSTTATASTASLSVYNLPKGVVYVPVLNLHDELIFEVRRSHLDEIATLIRMQMETSLELKVKLPVVIKSGMSWGSLMAMDLP